MKKRKSQHSEDRSTALIRRIFYRAAVRYGIVEPGGKSDAEIEREVLRWVDAWTNRDDVRFVLDHRPALLSAARRFDKNEHLELACVMYAIWTEHWLNGVIHVRAHANGLGEGEIKEVIRSVQVAGKTSWLWALLGLRPLARTHLGRIREVSEARNSFVHYKWAGTPESAEDEVKEKLRTTVSEYKKTVEYLQKYESEVIMKKSMRRIQRLAHSHARAVQQAVAADGRPRTAARR